MNTKDTSNNFSNKHYFVGLSLASGASIDSGAAVLDRNLNVIRLDKLFTMEDVKFFINNFTGKQDAIFNISIPENPTMLNAKWKLHSREYQLIQSSKLIDVNKLDWTHRFSTRGSEFFRECKSNGIDIFRFEIGELKSSFGLSGMYKDRSPVDCKAFQSALKYKFNIYDLPANMIPAAQLEAILGAYLGYVMYNTSLQYTYKIKAEYQGIDVIGIDFLHEQNFL